MPSLLMRRAFHGIALSLVLAPGSAIAQELTLGSPGQTLFRARCASCHDAAAGSPEATRAPSREALRARSRESIVAALSIGGSMATMATGLTAVEKAALAAFLSPIAEPPADPNAGRCTTQPSSLPDPATLPRWNGWGVDASNARFQPAALAGLTARTVPKLTLKWAFGIPGASAVSAQPTVYAGRVFIGSENGTVYALDAATGCLYWQFKAAGGVRSAITVAPLSGSKPARYAAYFGDFRANVYAVDALTGDEIWSFKADDHVSARITGAPALNGGRLYVPVSSLEELPAALAVGCGDTMKHSGLRLEDDLVTRALQAKRQIDVLEIGAERFGKGAHVQHGLPAIESGGGAGAEDRTC